MARYVIKVLDSRETREKLERAIQQVEDLDFTAVCLASGTVGGKRGNLLTLLRAQATGTVALEEIDGDATEQGQADRLNQAAGHGAAVSYARVYVSGVLKNVAMIRRELAG